MKKPQLPFILLFLLVLVGCTGTADHDDHDHEDHHDDHHAHTADATPLTLPSLTAVQYDGRLNVVATTSIIGDVVGEIGADAIALTTLMSDNTDPHSYQVTPSDLVALTEADIIFVNGWELEEQLAAEIENNYSDKMVAISAGVTPRTFDTDAADPHVWFAVDNVAQWTRNVETVLQTVDPANATVYEANAAAYQAQLVTLAADIEQMLADLPVSQRKLVTEHDALGYFAADHDFEIVGSVIPAFSTNAEPSARDLAALVDAMEQAEVCAILVEQATTPALAETVAAELDGCASVQVLPFYIGSIGAAGSYIGMYRANMATIMQGLSAP